MDVGIIGCGTAGAASALALSRAGHRVTVYERVPAPAAIGAGLVLQPTGLLALSRLDPAVHAEVAAAGAPITALRCETPRRRTLVDVAYAEVAPGLCGLGIHRGVLFRALLRAVQAAPVTLRLGVHIDTLVPDGARHALTTPTGERHGPHDLVIIADGARSSLRDDTQRALRTRVSEYAWGALWFVAPDPDGLLGARLYQIADGTRRLLGLLPTGHDPQGTRVGSIFWSIRGDRVPAWRAAGLAPWKADVTRYAPWTAPLLTSIEHPEQLIYTSYRHVSMPRWHLLGVVYLGDAAHAMSPQLGQGANLALFDAMVLADCLAGVAPDAPPPLAALARYSAQRLRHLRYYQRMTRLLTPLFQSDRGRFFAALRDLSMALACKIGPLRRMMVTTVLGIKRGLLRRSLPLAPLYDAPLLLPEVSPPKA